MRQGHQPRAELLPGPSRACCLEEAPSEWRQRARHWAQRGWAALERPPGRLARSQRQGQPQAHQPPVPWRGLGTAAARSTAQRARQPMFPPSVRQRAAQHRRGWRSARSVRRRQQNASEGSRRRSTLEKRFFSGSILPLCLASGVTWRSKPQKHLSPGINCAGSCCIGRGTFGGLGWQSRKDLGRHRGRRCC